tara:strand:+ start:19 stop:249 length:231 start_codon:yes stop_codon:yes gene_type:complete
MGRGRFRMHNNGGIAGSGVFGFIGTTIRCDADDNSMYCNLMKLINAIMMILFLFYIGYIIYQLVMPMSKSMKFGGR